MEKLRIRILGNELHAETLMNMLHGMDGVDHVEELPPADGHACDELCNIEVGVADDGVAHRIRMFTAGAAILLDASAEFVESFQGSQS